jgi:cytidylate kinase
MSADVFAASRDFSALLGGLLGAAGAPADEALAWLQQQYWERLQEEQERERKEREKKEQERKERERKERESRRFGSSRY